MQDRKVLAIFIDKHPPFSYILSEKVEYFHQPEETSLASFDVTQKDSIHIGEVDQHCEPKKMVNIDMKGEKKKTKVSNFCQVLCTCQMRLQEYYASRSCKGTSIICNPLLPILSKKKHTLESAWSSGLASGLFDLSFLRRRGGRQIESRKSQKIFQI